MAAIHNFPNSAPRLEKVDGGKLGIQSFGGDNGYPQRMLNIYNSSRSAKMCANLCARYIIGKGFQDLDFYNVVVNEEGHTPDKLLRRFAPDKSKLRGIAVHVNYNAMYQIVSVSHIPFENCRLGIEENKGKIGVYANWFSKGSGKRKNKDAVDFIYKYNPNPETIEAQVIAAGGWDYYKGQVLWISDDFDCYPLATIDPVLDDALAEVESGITRRSNLRNNFRLKQIWVEKGQLQDGESEEEVVEGIRDYMGPDGNDISVIFSKDPEGKDIPQLVPITNQLNDKLFQYTDESARLGVYTSFGQPAILHSDYMGTNGYNDGQLPQSMKYYIAYTEPDRILMEEVFRELFSRFHLPINPTDDYTISPLDVVDNSIKVEEEDTRSLIEIIGIGGATALTAIQANAAFTAVQKRDTIMIVFGVTEENANKLAGYLPETV